VARQVGLGFLLYLNPPIEVPVYSATGEVQGNVRLPDVYRVPVRKDLIHRVFMSEFTAAIQPKGRDPMAGMRTTAVSLGIHHGLARVPRVKGSTRARLAPFVRGGRLAHPPRVDENIKEEVNKLERLRHIVQGQEPPLGGPLDIPRRRPHIGPHIRRGRPARHVGDALQRGQTPKGPAGRLCVAPRICRGVRRQNGGRLGRHSPSRRIPRQHRREDRHIRFHPKTGARR